MSKISRGMGLKSRSLLIAALVLVALVLLVAACGSSNTKGGTTGGGAPKAGGTYNYPLGAEPPCIEPLNIQEVEGAQVGHQVFWGLVNYQGGKDTPIEAVPAVAESWSANADATVWTFKLRKGVTFGPPVNREVTADDFVYSWNRATDPANQSYVSYILAPIKGCGDDGYWDNKVGLTGVKALDPYTLQVTLRYPFAEFPLTLGHTVAAPVPKEYVEKLGNKAFGEKPVGDGPYMVQEWQHKKQIVLVKNPNFWDKSRAGYVDTINMPIYLNPSTEWLEFQKGTTDFSSVPAGQVTPAENNPKVKSGEWTAYKYPNLGIYYVGFNMSNPVVGGASGLPLRQMLYYASDTQNVINVVNEGVSLPATGYVPTGIKGFIPNQSPYSYDPEKAKALMAQVGTVPKMTYWYNTEGDHQKIAEALLAGWQPLGINVELSGFEWATFLEKIKGTDHEMFRMGWVADYPSMDNFLFPIFQSKQSPYMGFFYNNPDFDALLQKARGTVDDTARYALYGQAEKMALTDIPAIPLYTYRDFRVTNNRVGGFDRNSMGYTDMWKVWIK